MKKILISLLLLSTMLHAQLSNADYFRYALPEAAKTWEGYIVLGSGAGAAALASFADKPVRDFMTQKEYLPPALSKIADLYVDHYWCFAVSALGALGKGIQTDNYWEPFRYWAVSNVTMASLTYILKFSFHRERPNSRNCYSFPSGHSASAFATATLFQMWYGWPLGVPAYALAALSAFQRLDDNQHWLSDVVMGTSIGIVIPYMLYRGEEKAKSNDRPLFIPPISVSIPLNFPLKK